MLNVKNLTDLWENQSTDFKRRQRDNVFSEHYEEQKQYRWKRGDPGYGIPEGKTAERGQKAQKYIDNQISLLLIFMRKMAKPTNTVRFIELFERYSTISSNLVGLLICARKRGLVDFDGEILLQRRDDDALITILCETR